MANEKRRTDKHEQARNSLPTELVSVFDDLVADYKFFATKHHGLPFVSYAILAEMVRAGWRLSVSPGSDENKKSNETRE
jgi:hypothetical protein